MDKIVFFDTETTGLPDWKKPSDGKEQPHIVSLSAIQCHRETGEEIERINVIVRPEGWKIPEDSIKIHGISNEVAQNQGLNEKLCICFLIELCYDSARCCFNRTFDQRIIRIGLKRYGMEKTMKTWADKENFYCTMLESSRIMRLPPRGKYGWRYPKLEAAYKFFCGKELGEKAHNSMNDTMACKKLYYAIRRHPQWKKNENKNDSQRQHRQLLFN